MILVSVPLVAAILCASIFTYASWSRYGDLVRASSLLRLAAAAGRFAGMGIPGEGAATREFLLGNGDKAALDTQRRRTDDLYRAVREAAAANIVRDAKITEHLLALDERQRETAALRDRIDAKTVTSVDA